MAANADYEIFGVEEETSPNRFSGLFAKVEMANTWSSPPNWVCIWVWDCPPDPSRLLCRNLCIAVDLLGSQHPTSDPDLTELG
uniref:HDC03009 n=1 Tax=Drosophila melanogaster TaxID=7227 RepID=Q6IH87_DROME|nr:TPA_inf: HDC03009 [Drosophila melanogaster]